MTERCASPVCYASEADDQYMGYWSRDEIVTALNELLEAERAGARVALASARSLASPAYSELMHAIRDDEAKWCAMLRDQVCRLGGSPSRRCGHFRIKAMAIQDPYERLAFLNRGQSWVVRRLDELRPRVRDPELREHLKSMSDAHRANVELVERFLLLPSSD